MDKEIGGPDADFSLDPEEFKNMVESVRKAEKASGEVTYED
ncbi:MAG: N-acetylneuraminate synthase family protein [Fodinibius sp.]|nr:N-acetylneuraminate synthase family protein [Fodinibius sp.]